MGDSAQPHPTPDPSPSPAAPAASPADAVSPGQRDGGAAPSSAQAWYADEEDEKLVASEAAAAPSDRRGGAASGSSGAPAAHGPADAGQAGGSSRAGNHCDGCAVLHACAALDFEIWALHASLACDHAPCPVAQIVHYLKNPYLKNVAAQTPMPGSPVMSHGPRTALAERYPLLTAATKQVVGREYQF